jgi:Putative peptidoglycan binding domain
MSQHALDPDGTPLFDETSGRLLFTPDPPPHRTAATRAITPVRRPSPRPRSLSTTPAELLAQGGIINPAGVIALAADAGLELAMAATMLIMESSGGRNVWGSDRVLTGGIYTPGGVVTRDVYLAYKARRAVLGDQGVGPTQLTSSGLQDQADALGGCWDWASNCRVGFAFLAGLIHRNGEDGGLGAYNGSGPNGHYVQEALPILAGWRQRLGAPAAPDNLPALVLGDRGPAVASLQAFLNRFDWRPALPLLPITGFYGTETAGVLAAVQLQCGIHGGDGRNLGPQTRAALWARGWRG